MTRVALVLAAVVLAADAAPKPQAAVDQTLLTAARKSAEAHRKADALERERQPAQAAQVLDDALAVPCGDGDDCWQLRSDLQARLVQLKKAAGDPAGALRVARASVEEAKGRPASIYLAQLWLRLGEALEYNNDDEGAVNAFQTAIVVAKQVLAARQDAGRAQ